MFWRIARKTVAALATALTAVALTAVFLHNPAQTQTQPPTTTTGNIPLLAATGCTDGTFVDTAANPTVKGANNDLVDDCQALVAIQNHWASNSLNNTLPMDHLLRTWGTGTTEKIGTWAGITVTSGRVTATDLQRLHYGGPAISGTIPTQFGNLTNLTNLNLYSKRLSGSIPAQLGSLTNLTTLDLARNQLTGPIPTQLSQLTNLTILRLDGNQLTGPIPTQLGSLTNLTILWLDGNQLTGSIPAELGNLAPSQGGSLSSFGFCQNYLTGAVPVAWRTDVQIGGYPTNEGYDPVACQRAADPPPPSSSTTTTTTTTVSPSSSTEAPRDGEQPIGPVWNVLTVQQRGTTASQIRQTLSLTSRDAIYTWDTEEQRWQRASASQTIPAGTAVTFRTEQPVAQDDLETINLGTDTRRTSLSSSWNILSAPARISLPATTSDTPSETGDTAGGFLFAGEMLDCDSPTAILAVASYSPTARQWSLWLPCHPAAQTRLTTGDNPPYRPLTAISPADITYIYTRTNQPLNIAWNPDTNQYQPVISIFN